MTDFNKLADALESYTGDGHGYQIDDAVLREAARILRAAAGVDAAGLSNRIIEKSPQPKPGGETRRNAVRRQPAKAMGSETECAQPPGAAPGPC